MSLTPLCQVQWVQPFPYSPCPLGQLTDPLQVLLHVCRKEFDILNYLIELALEVNQICGVKGWEPCLVPEESTHFHGCYSFFSKVHSTFLFPQVSEVFALLVLSTLQLSPVIFGTWY